MMPFGCMISVPDIPQDLTAAWLADPSSLPHEIGMGMILGVTLLWAVPVILTQRKRRRAMINRCPKCGYSRTGLPSDRSCPECGTTAVVEDAEACTDTM